MIGWIGEWPNMSAMIPNAISGTIRGRHMCSLPWMPHPYGFSVIMRISTMRCGFCPNLNCRRLTRRCSSQPRVGILGARKGGMARIGCGKWIIWSKNFGPLSRSARKIAWMKPENSGGFVATLIGSNRRSSDSSQIMMWATQGWSWQLFRCPE